MKSQNKWWSLLGLAIVFVFSFIACQPQNKIGDLSVDRSDIAGISSSGDTISLIISSSQDFHIKPQNDWLTSNLDLGSGRNKVKINVAPNFTKEERIGSLLISTSDQSVKVTLHQQTGEVRIDEYPYEIPVIFHVLYNEDEQQRLISQNDKNDDVPDYKPINSEQLQTILNQVNRIYRGDPELPTNSIERTNYEKTRGNYVNANVKFVMASKDKDGNKLSPIGIRTYAIPEKSLSPETVMSDKEGGKYHKMAFPINKYINVFIFPFTSKSANSMTLGIAHFPHISTSYPLEGLAPGDESVSSYTNYNHCIAINSRIFEPLVQRRLYREEKVPYFTLAHELGHILGLRHVFAEAVTDKGLTMVDDCIDSDFCADTESYNRISYDRNRLPVSSTNNKYAEYVGLRRRTNCTQGAFVSTNIMDYEVSWNDRLTPDQLKRVRHVLYYSFNIPGPKLVTPTKSLRGMDTRYAEPIVSGCPSEHLNH